MKVILEFNLPEEEETYKLCMEGHKWYAIVREILHELRQRYKHSESTMVDSSTYCAELKQWIHECMDENEVSL